MFLQITWDNLPAGEITSRTGCSMYAGLLTKHNSGNVFEEDTGRFLHNIESLTVALSEDRKKKSLCCEKFCFMFYLVIYYNFPCVKCVLSSSCPHIVTSAA